MRDHHCLTPCWHCLSQGWTCATDNATIRSRSERGRLSRVTGLDATSRSWTAAAKMNRGRATRSRSVPGERTWARSLTQACTCEGRTAASRMEPILVPSMCLLIREATRERSPFFDSVGGGEAESAVVAAGDDHGSDAGLVYLR